MRKFWSPERDEELKRLYFQAVEYPDMSAAEINRTLASLMGCSPVAIEIRRAKLNLRVPTSFKYRPERK